MVVIETEGIGRSYATRLDIVQEMGWYSSTFMASTGHLAVHLSFSSALDMTDFVQVVGDHVSRLAGLDEDALHWVNVAVRECVINAIKHGNRQQPDKQVFVDFEVRIDSEGRDLLIRVRDQGEGFEPEEIADPLAPENLLKASGRGIFLIRNFMDDVQLQRAPEGGMEIRMLKRVQPTSAS